MSNYIYKPANNIKTRLVERLKREGIAYWQIADYYGVHDNTIVRWMRNPTPEVAEHMNAAIDAIVACHNRATA